jgi:hypothetical protein
MCQYMHNICFLEYSITQCLFSKMGWDDRSESFQVRMRMEATVTYLKVLAWYSPTEIEVTREITSTGEIVE